MLLQAVRDGLADKQTFCLIALCTNCTNWSNGDGSGGASRILQLRSVSTMLAWVTAVRGCITELCVNVVAADAVFPW